MFRSLLYGYRVFAKWLSFAVFGAGTLNLITVLFPLMRLFLHPRRRFQKYARRLVSAAFRIFIRFMQALGAVSLEVDDREYYRKLSGKIVAANHPSLLDVVMLISLIPNADCVVRSNLSKTIVSGVIRQLYIPNGVNFGKLMEDCGDSLRQGNCIIIFPEGTRTPRNGEGLYKKGAARISLASRCPVVPVRIGGNDKYGLGKGDPWTGFNRAERYVYKISAGTELSPGDYPGGPSGVRRFTADIREQLT
ncbi:MAG: 1-acyl-sn-glycerol-3-phosphate acyltransferase [Treponema sp.]|jgi:1-acyl-sn-glycerol-3-phosphate acyltransferase|nr:1-acyl-sn-glycerol-3-phosphate acyltransferase [Treponema sp.]